MLMNQMESIELNGNINTARKVSIIKVILVRIFLYSD